MPMPLLPPPGIGRTEVMIGPMFALCQYSIAGESPIMMAKSAGRSARVIWRHSTCISIDDGRITDSMSG
ncbi:hypothetical protein D3C83_146580 [compost metagenome]